MKMPRAASFCGMNTDAAWGQRPADVVELVLIVRGACHIGANAVPRRAMKPFQLPTHVAAALLAGTFFLTPCVGASPQAETAPVPVVEAREKAQAILEDVRERELETQLELKQTELQRLNEDLQKRQNESEILQRSMDSIAIALAEGGDTTEQLLARKKHLSRALELTTQRIEAEKLKMDGLKSLSDAQAKARERAARQHEETTIRSNIAGTEFRILSQKQNVQEDGAKPKDDSAKLVSEIAELKKRLEKADRNTASALKLAREAMTTANAKLLQAESAGARAKKTARDWGLTENAEPLEGAPEAVGEEPTELKPESKN